MPELPEAMQARFERDYGLSAYDAATLTAARETAAYFEQAVAATDAANAKLCANWVMGELAARLNREEKDIAAAPLARRAVN